MGLIIPRPSIRQREARIITARLKRHAELTLKFISEGMDKDYSSKKAYDQVLTEKFK